MTNPDQKTILLEQAYDELKALCAKFQDESGATDMEVVQLVSKIRRFKIISVSNQLTAKNKKPLQKFQLLKGLLNRLATRLNQSMSCSKRRVC